MLSAMVEMGGETKPIKVALAPDEYYYQYPLAADGIPRFIPLTRGDISYTARVYRDNIMLPGEYIFSPKIKDSPFIYPSLVVNYGAKVSSVAQRIANAFGEPASDRDLAAAINLWVQRNVLYDYINIAAKAKWPYVPDVDKILGLDKPADGKPRVLTGTCYDIAALTAALMRAMGLPCKVMVGTLQSAAHAWNEILIDGEWEVQDNSRNGDKKLLKGGVCYA